MPSVYLILAGFSTGIVIFRFPVALVPGLCMGLFLGFLFVFPQLRKWRRHFFFFGAMVYAGFAFSGKGQFWSNQPVDAFAPREYSSVEGIVKDLPSATLTGKRVRIRFVLDAERFLYPLMDCSPDALPFIDNLQVENASGKIQVFLVNPSYIPEPGDRVRVFGTIQRPQGPLNPGEMDYAAYLAASRIYATFSGVGPAALSILEPGAQLDWDARIQRIRGILALRLDRSFGTGELYAELLKALLLGLRSQFPQELWQVMMRTGTAHIISISGLHMSVLSAFVYMLFLILFCSQKKAAVGASAALILYMFLAGGSIPVQRAALMGAAAYAGILMERQVQPMRLLAWACLLQLIQDPFSGESISFQLSFLSVFILLLLRHLPRVHWIIEPFRSTALVLAGTLPLAAWHFNMISWTSFIANIWAIPFLNFALVTGAVLLALADVPGVGWLTARACELFLDIGLWGLQGLAQWRYGWSVVAQPPIWKVVHYYAWAAGWFLVNGVFAEKVKPYLRPVILVGWLAAASFFWIASDKPIWSITVLAGTRLPMAHIQSGKTNWIVNAGQASGGIETERRLIPYLKWRGIQRLEGILLTDYPKDVDLALHKLQDGVELKKVLGPVPKGAQVPAFFLKKSRISWQRISSTPGMVLGSFKILALSQGGKIKLIQLTAPNGVFLFLVMQLDDECAAVIERSRHDPAILILYGPAGGDQPGVRRRRDFLQKRMSHAVWVFSNESRGGVIVQEQTGQTVQSYSLKKMGALQIRESSEYQSGRTLQAPISRLVYLQFLAGYGVTLI